MTILKISIRKVTKAKPLLVYLLKMNWKNYKHLIQFIFRGRSHFEEDGTQNYLVFQLIYRYYKKVVNFDYILEWKSKGVSDESIKSPSAPHNFLNASVKHLCTKTRVRFSGSCFKHDKTTYTHGKAVNIYIVIR